MSKSWFMFLRSGEPFRFWLSRLSLFNWLMRLDSESVTLSMLESREGVPLVASLCSFRSVMLKIENSLPFSFFYWLVIDCTLFISWFSCAQFCLSNLPSFLCVFCMNSSCYSMIYISLMRSFSSLLFSLMLVFLFSFSWSNTSKSIATHSKGEESAFKSLLSSAGIFSLFSSDKRLVSLLSLDVKWLFPVELNSPSRLLFLDKLSLSKLSWSSSKIRSASTLNSSSWSDN